MWLLNLLSVLQLYRTVVISGISKVIMRTPLTRQNIYLLGNLLAMQIKKERQKKVHKKSAGNLSHQSRRMEATTTPQSLNSLTLSIVVSSDQLWLKENSRPVIRGLTEAGKNSTSLEVQRNNHTASSKTAAPMKKLKFGSTPKKWKSSLCFQIWTCPRLTPTELFFYTTYTIRIRLVWLRSSV